MYLLSACALSFKPLFRIVARALRLQSLVTHTKSTFQPGKSYTNNKTVTATQVQFEMQHVRHPSDVTWDSRSENSVMSKQKIEVLVTKTVEVELNVRAEA
jgi:hypothetical protein